MQTVLLNNGVAMPQLGLGVWQAGNGQDLDRAVKTALETGYRLFDTASFYQNEDGVGKAIAESGIDRSSVFITTKVWNDEQGYQETKTAIQRSMDALRTDYIDLYLIHWPVRDKYKDTWRAMEECYQKGWLRAIGLSNFLQRHIEDLLPHCSIKPMVNQLEHHPLLVQKDLQLFCQQNQIQFEAWRPLMGGSLLSELELLQELAQKYQKTPAQILLRWNIQNNIVTIPKSITPQRIRDNFNIWDFALEEADMLAIDALDQGRRLGPDPDTFV